MITQITKGKCEKIRIYLEEEMLVFNDCEVVFIHFEQKESIIIVRRLIDGKKVSTRVRESNVLYYEITNFEKESERISPDVNWLIDSNHSVTINNK